MKATILARSALRRLLLRVAAGYGDHLSSLIEKRVQMNMSQIIDQRVEALLAKRMMPTAEQPLLDAQQTSAALSLLEKRLAPTIYLPPIDLNQTSAELPFMRYSTCSAADFYHPRFSEIAAEMAIPAMLHRKFWEWAYIVHIAQSRGVVAPGKRALGFGVGTERMPALFAKGGMEVTASGAPQSVDTAQGWSSTGQYSNAIEAIPYGGILDKETFLERVRFQECDMNNIGDDVQGYDFCWSSCALEHLGSLRLGMDFIINSVEKTLKIGGIACHTTEFNLSSNGDTIESGDTVLYRRKDLDALIAELRARGHKVDEFIVAPDAHFLDGYVDTPPFATPTPTTGPAHLKLELYGYACTSVGITVQRCV